MSTGADKEDSLATRTDHEGLGLLRTRQGPSLEDAVARIEDAVARILARTPVLCVHTYVAQGRPQLDLSMAVCSQCGETA